MAADTISSAAGVAGGVAPGVAVVVGGQGTGAIDVVRGPAEVDSGDRDATGRRGDGDAFRVAVVGAGQELPGAGRLRGPTEVDPALKDQIKINIDAEGSANETKDEIDVQDFITAESDGEMSKSAKAPDGEESGVAKEEREDNAGEGSSVRKGETVKVSPSRQMVMAPIRWLGAGNMNRGTPPKRPSSPADDDTIKQEKLRDSGRVHMQELLTYEAVPEGLVRNRPQDIVDLVEAFFRKLHDTSVTRRRVLFMDLNGLRGTKGYSSALKRLAEQRDEVDADVDTINKRVKKGFIKAPSYFVLDPELLPK